MTTLDQRRALALRIAKTIGRDPASIVAALRSRLDTSFKFNPRQRRDDHGRWSDGGPSVPNMPSGPNFGGGGHDYVKGGKQQTIRYKVGDGPEKSITGRVIRERPDSISVVKRGHPDSATEIIQKKHIIHEGEVKPRAGTFIGNVPETHKNARPQGDGGEGPTRTDNERRRRELQDMLEGDQGLTDAQARELKDLNQLAKSRSHGSSLQDLSNQELEDKIKVTRAQHIYASGTGNKTKARKLEADLRELRAEHTRRIK